MQIWDTAGQERFKTLTQNYYKDAQGIIFTFDCTDQKSFDDIRMWVKSVEHKTDVVKVLFGNKADLEDDRIISNEEGESLAEEYGMTYFEGSAKADLNVAETFYHLAKTIKETASI